MQGNEAGDGDGARGEQRFKSYDQTDQREGTRHAAMNFNGRGGDDDDGRDARARSQLAGDRDGYQTSIRRFGDEGGECCTFSNRERRGRAAEGSERKGMTECDLSCCYCCE